MDDLREKLRSLLPASSKRGTFKGQGHRLGTAEVRRLVCSDTVAASAPAYRQRAPGSCTARCDAACRRHTPPPPPRWCSVQMELGSQVAAVTWGAAAGVALTRSRMMAASRVCSSVHTRVCRHSPAATRSCGQPANSAPSPLLLVRLPSASCQGCMLPSCRRRLHASHPNPGPPVHPSPSLLLLLLLPSLLLLLPPLLPLLLCTAPCRLWCRTVRAPIAAARFCSC